MIFKPKYDTTVKGFLKDGSVVFFTREKVFDREYNRYIDNYIDEVPSSINIKKELKNWRSLNTVADYEEATNYILNYYKLNKFLAKRKCTPSERAFIDWENSHIDFLITWCNHFGYSDSNIENPEYVFSRVFKAGYECANLNKEKNE